MQAAELGYEALALTDHDGVYGSLEFAHAAKALGVRPITGAELTLLDGSHVTVLVESQRGYANLCRLVTAAHAGTRPPGRESQPPGDPALDPGVLAELNEGLIVLSGCARRGLGVRERERSRAALAPAFARPLLRRAAAALRARRRAPERGAARSGGDARRADGRDRRRPRALARTAPSCRTCSWRSAATRRSRPASGAAREPRGRPPLAGRARGAVPGRPRRRRAHRRSSPQRCDVRPDARARLPLPRLLGRRRAGDRDASPDLRPRVRRALRRNANGTPAPRARAPRRRAGADRPPRPGRLLPPPLRGARARARGGAGGAGLGLPARTSCRRAAAGAAPSARSSAT